VCHELVLLGLAAGRKLTLIPFFKATAKPVAAAASAATPQAKVDEDVIRHTW
jgi:hypothetical protein